MFVIFTENYKDMERMNISLEIELDNVKRQLEHMANIEMVEKKSEIKELSNELQLAKGECV